MLYPSIARNITMYCSGQYTSKSSGARLLLSTMTFRMYGSIISWSMRAIERIVFTVGDAHVQAHLHGRQQILRSIFSWSTAVHCGHRQARFCRRQWRLTSSCMVPSMTIKSVADHISLTHQQAGVAATRPLWSRI